MPEISRFFGIVIGMFHREHGPPHFHAVYAEHKMTVDIETGAVTGSFPASASGLVLEWYAHHKEELLGDWDLARRGQPLKRISPLR